jgi:hypothetical protein
MTIARSASSAASRDATSSAYGVAARDPTIATARPFSASRAPAHPEHRRRRGDRPQHRRIRVILHAEDGDAGRARLLEQRARFGVRLTRQRRGARVLAARGDDFFECDAPVCVRGEL